jgi:hypothetical protein
MLNPFIAICRRHLPILSAASPGRAREAKALKSRARRATPTQPEDLPVSAPRVDPKSHVGEPGVSRRTGGAGGGACSIHTRPDHQDNRAPLVYAEGDWQALSAVASATHRRVARGHERIPEADMLAHRAQARRLHNGSVPTLGQLACPAARPGILPRQPVLATRPWSASMRTEEKARYGPTTRC